MSSKTVKKIKLNFLFGLLAQVVGLVVGIIVPRLFIVNYGSEANGYINSINQIFVYVALLEAGIGSAAVSALYAPVASGDKNKINGILSATNRYYTRTAFFYLAIVVALSFVYPLVVASELPYYLMVGIFLINGASGVVAYFFHAKYKLLLSVDGRSYVTSAVTSVYQVFLSVGKAVFLLLGFHIFLVQGLYLLLGLVQALIFAVYVKRAYPWLNVRAEPDRASLSKSKNALVHQISGLVFNNTDVLVLTFFCNLKVVSVYALYKTLIGLVGTLINHFTGSLSFKMGQTFHDRDRFIKMFDAYETIHISLSFALCTVAYILFLPFLRLYTAGMDADYLLTYMPLLAVLAEVLSFIRLPSQDVITFAGHFKETQWRSVLESVINLSTSLVLVVVFEQLWGLGIYGVLIGTVVALLYRTNDIFIYTNKKILGRSPLGVYKTCLINCAVSVLAVLGYNLISPTQPGYVSVILTAVVLCAILLPLCITVSVAANRNARTFTVGLLKTRVFKKR